MTPLTNPSSQPVPEIAGYQIAEQLYLGSRTAVYRAVQTATQRPVVMKVLRREYPSFSELVQFRNQYTIMRCLADANAKNLPIPGIVRPLELEPLGSSYALVMEDWGGVALSKYMQQQSLDLTEVLAIALQIADILHDLCQHRVVHKDIKPANILIHPESKQVKLIDFSIASLLPKETQEIQSPNILEGTLAYLAPEQTGRMNRGIDYRADFYALGITLYQMLTGTLPFESSDPLELVHCHIAKVPVPVDQVNPAIPAIVAAIVAKLMAKNAEERYQSALGLKHDLEGCLTQWKETGAIASFKLGERDLSDRFLIPEKLYGREAEVQVLLDAFDRVASGASELMLVAGFSGIGKTAVVNEVHKPITRQQGYFIKGKFDQFNRNIPLSAFVQALRDLMGQLLSESDAQLTQWQTKILQAVGENGQVLIDVIPELEQIIGKQLAAPELSGSAAQNRFNLLFQKFIEVFTTAEHPLVLFLDDLQWADLASLQLIKLLMNDNGYLLMLGAYRDNEVSPAHPFMLTIEELKKAQAIVNTITLAPLAFADTNHLVADTLNCSLELAQPLTELVDRKTKGNPFFTTQFIKALHEENHITFNQNLRYWECDIAQVNALALTDDVVEFMALQLQKLSNETQQVLKLAACVGNQFDLATLAIVSEQSSTDTAAALWNALQEGLILPTSQSYKFFQDGEHTDTQNTVNPAYRFLHDRVQQAAYSLIPEDQQQSTHLAIARLLRQNTPDAELEANIFEIVSHWNRAIALLIDPLEKTNLAQLNLIAGSRAKVANAYEPALKYCRTGLVLLDDLDGWRSQTSLMLALHEGAAAAAYLCGDFAQMEQWASAILAQKLAPLDRVKTYEIQIQAHGTQSQFPEAIAIARTALEQFNVHLPIEPTFADIVPAMQDIAALFNGRTAHDLLDLPVMTDVASLASMQLLLTITATSYISTPLLFPFVVLAQVKLSIQKGNTAISAYGYSNYAVLLSSILEDLDAAYEFGQLGLKLAEKFKVPTIQAKVNFMVGTFILNCKSHCRNSLPLFTEAFKIGLAVGDLECTGYSTAYRYQFSYAVGQELTTLLAEIEIYIATLLKLNIVASSNLTSTVFQTIQRLQATRNEAVLTAQKELHHTLTISNDLTGLHWYWISRLTASYLLNEMVEAKQDAAEARQTLAAGAGLISAPIFYFYDSLTALADFSEVTDKSADLERVLANQAQLQNRAHHAPMNFQHKYDLVEAERSRVLNNKAEAIALYDRAISGAKANGYIQEEALANELAAKFYLNWGKEKIAQEYLTNAYYGYAHWGATAKVQDLERRYPELLAPILQQQQTALSATETVFAPVSLTASGTSGTQSSSSGSTSISASLDLGTVLKVSQTLSSEIQLDKLLATLLHTVLENAGADKGVLLMPREHQWFVEAIATLDQPAQVQAIALSDSPEVPHSLIHAVKRTRRPMVIFDAAAHPTLATDAYIVQHQPKSLLCTPILQQGKLVAILYLENQITVGSFTDDRVELLNVLCSQSAISLENARLYSQAQEKQRQMTTLLSNLTGMAYSCANDAEWTMKFVSEGCLSLTGYKPEELIDNHLISYAKLICTDDAERVDTVVQNALQARQPFQISYRIRTKQGEEKWVGEQGQGVFDQEGHLLSIEGLITDISDRKAAETALTESEAYHRNLFDHSSIGLILCSMNGQLVYANAAYAHILGRTPEELPALSYWDITPEKYANAEQLQLQSLQTTGRYGPYEKEYFHKDGTLIPVQLSGVIVERNGEQYIWSSVEDISDRKAAETALAESETKFRRLVEGANDIIWSSHLDSTLTYLSPQFQKVFGWEPQDWVGKSFMPLVHPEDLPNVLEFVQQIVESGEKGAGQEFRHPCKDGRLGWLTSNITPVKDENGVVIGLQGILRDISDRKLAETELQEKNQALEEALSQVQQKSDQIERSQQRLKLLIQQTPLAVIEWDTNYEIQAWNPAAEKVFGYSATEVIGQHLRLLILEEYHVYVDQVASALLSQSGGSHALNDNITKDGRLIACEWFNAPLIAVNGEILGGVSMALDISDRKIAEDQIQQKNQELQQALTQLQHSQAQVVQSEKMSALGNLVAGVAHEINNPVGFLNGSIKNAKDYVQDLLEYVALYQKHHPNAAAPVQDHAEDIDLEFLNEDLPKLLDSMKGATDRIKGISTSLRIFSRADTDHKVSANLHEGIDSTILILKYRLKANEKRPEIAIIKDYGDLPSIDCFPGQLNQVFMNILANAIDMFDEIALTQFFAELEANPQQITIRTAIVANQVQIQIGDNGKGMSEDVQAKIFDHLFTTKEVGKGTGLGLAIAHQIVVEKHGGTLEVQSELGQGTQFLIQLPM